MNLLDCYIPVFTLITDIEANHTQYNCFQEIRTKCTLAIEQAVLRSEEINVTDKDRDDVFYAVTVFIDEKILCSSLSFTDKWRDNLLQYKFFGCSVGGELFFEKLDSLDEKRYEAKGVFLFCLLLGFKGKHADDETGIIANYIATLHKSFFNEHNKCPEVQIIETTINLRRSRRPTFQDVIVLILVFYIAVSLLLLN
ncbi:DotU family type IV/VI secretion system protein [Escherichia coli]